MKKRGIIKGIINYIFAMVFAIIFALFLDANVGWFIVLTLILAPLLSIFLAWLSSGLLEFSCEMEEALLSKGDTSSMQIRVQNHSIFPTPPIEVTLTNEAGVRCKDKKLLVSVMSKATQVFDVVFKAKICGKSIVGIETVRVTDYLGLFSFAVKRVNYDALKRKVAVIPNIAEISARDDNLVKVMQTSLHMEDSDDTVESSAHSFGGFPGYDNRDYVPGDPLKRINWKQSAKRNKLLVRLDDEMAARSINVVLDSVFHKEALDPKMVSFLQPYKGLTIDEILPKIAEDAVENALGISRVLIRQNYTVNFYAMFDGQFIKYELLDEIDLENIRLQLASFSFYGEEVSRIPSEDADFQEKVGLFSTPNSYEDAYAALGDQAHYTNVYSVLEEAKKFGGDEGAISLREPTAKKEEKRSLKEMVLGAVVPLVIPYLLAFALSTSVFYVFDVPIMSYWGLAQALVCAGIIAFCGYVNRHRIVGSMIIVVSALGIFYTCVRLIANYGSILYYIYWFISGGTEVETNASYLLTLLLVFTVFFSMVVYYFTKVLYRTSFLMLVSLLPFVIYVKVMLDLNIAQVIVITVLNVAAFLVNTRTKRDAGKRIVGYGSGLVSVLLYSVLFVLIGQAVPEMETKYYYMFENAFLGGNDSQELPQEYSEMSEYSGNADGFNEMNNRKLYVITDVDGGNLYLKRQTFDLYDFEYDRWYPIDAEEEPVYSTAEWEENKGALSLIRLVEAMQLAEQYEPGLLAEYGLQNIPTDFSDTGETIYVETTNFPSVAYITPPNTIKVTVQHGDPAAQENIGISKAGVFQSRAGLLDADIEYAVEYYDENAVCSRLLAAGVSNLDKDMAQQMLERMQTVLEANQEEVYADVLEKYIQEYNYAEAYKKACEENTALIPERVKELAKEITKDCVYDWEKADALQRYFRENDFVYDLSYDAPDDSVEYFLFKGKTGTCSDYASAYVLMARSVGLIVRYAEGFVPDIEYNGDYVVRTDCGHAYPEVYIPNVGFVIYEATQPANYNYTDNGMNGGMLYFLTVFLQIFYVFAVVSVLIIILLFIHRIAAPYVSELYFLRKIRSLLPSQAVVMLYKRLQQRHLKDIIRRGSVYTPYEYAQVFEEMLHYDISELAYAVEYAVYAQNAISDIEKTRAQELYQGAREAIKEWKKQEKKQKS